MKDPMSFCTLAKLPIDDLRKLVAALPDIHHKHESKTLDKVRTIRNNFNLNDEFDNQKKKKG